MAINLETQYPGKVAPSSAAYPYGAARNVTLPNDGTGTPFEAALVNDVIGFQQSLLTDAGLVPSGSPDEVGASQYLQAMTKIAGRVFPTVTAMVNSATLKVGDRVTTFANQNGAVLNQKWEIVAAATGAADGGSYIGLTGSGLQAKQIFPAQVTPEHFGAYGDGVTDDTSFFVAANSAGYMLYGGPLSAYAVSSMSLNPAYGFIGRDGGTTIKVVSGTAFVPNQRKGLKIKNINFDLTAATTCKGIDVGGMWDSDVDNIKFQGNEAAATPYVTVGMSLGTNGGGTWGCQGNVFKNLRYYGCVEQINATNEYVNGNTFVGGILFGNTSLKILSTAKDAHGNTWIGRIFQNCSEVSDLKGQGNTLQGCYIENSQMSGPWSLPECVINGSTDSRTRADKLSRLKLAMYSQDNGAYNYIPVASNTMLKDERFYPTTGVTVQADTDAVSKSGLVFSKSGGAGSYAYFSVVSNAEIAGMIEEAGAVTVTFDAKRVSGSSGLVEIATGSFVLPSVTSSTWQRYSYVIKNPAGFLRVYVANASAGEVLITNININAGHTSTNAGKPQYPVLYNNAPKIQQQYDQASGLYTGTIKVALTNVNAITTIIDTNYDGTIGNFINADFKVFVRDSDGTSGGYGLYSCNGHFAQSYVVGADTYRGGITVGEVVSSGTLTAPTLSFNVTTGVFAITSTSGNLSNVYVTINYMSNYAVSPTIA